MHPCLSVPEIRMKVAIGDGCEYDMEWKKSLVSLALTCKAFYGPSMDALWHTLYTLRPLLYTLPSDVRPIGNGHAEKPADKVILRLLTHAEVSRIMSYADRVRVYGRGTDFHSQERSMSELTEDEYRLLSTLAADSVLLRRVKDVTLCDLIPDNLPFLKLLLPLNLRKLEMRMVPLGDIMAEAEQYSSLELAQYCTFLTSIRNNCSDLNQLTINLWHIKHKGSTALLLRQFTETISSSNLQQLNLSPVTFDIIPLLNSLSRLRDLRLDFLDIVSPLSQPLHSLSSVPKEMIINCEDLAHLIHFIRCLPSGSATGRLSLHANTPSSTLEQWLQLTREIHDRIIPSTLHHLTINETRSFRRRGQPANDQDGAQHRYIFQVIEPLLKFRELTFFEIRTCGWVDISDDNMMIMTSSWRKLQWFTLDGWHLQGEKPSNTLKSLFWLAKNCRRVNFVEFALDASFPGSAERHAQKVAQSVLMSLDVRYSPIADPVMVASYLSDIFPGLGNYEWGGESVASTGGKAKHSKKWAQASKLIPAFVAARRDEIDRCEDNFDEEEAPMRMLEVLEL